MFGLTKSKTKPTVKKTEKKKRLTRREKVQVDFLLQCYEEEKEQRIAAENEVRRLRAILAGISEKCTELRV